MVGNRKIVICAVAAAVGLAAAFWLIPSDEKRVRKQFGRLADLVGKKSSA